jgi:rubrerythrin
LSRVPRSREHLKTGFISEAACAARFRAFARRAEKEGLPNLAERWLALAVAKDELAILQLEAADQVRRPEQSVADALAEERYENDVLYPKMILDVDPETADVFRHVMGEQQSHVSRLEELRADLQSAARRDLP